MAYLPRTIGIGIGLALALAGCGTNAAPSLDALDDQLAAVGEELAVPLRAYDPDGDAIELGYRCDDLPDLAERQNAPRIDVEGTGRATFRWIPTGSDVRTAPYAFVFSASDGRAESRRTVPITVRGQAGSGAPVFVRPLGSGTTLERDVTPCLELEVEVTDPDSGLVTIGQEPPLLEGATLEPTGPLSALWRWCPTDEQVLAQDRFYLRLSAADGVNPPTLKLPPYLIVVVGSGKGEGCPGVGPVVTHAPLPGQNTVQDLEVVAQVTDDVGLKATPLLYWSTVDPGTPPALALMTPVSMVRTSGDTKSGTYSGQIPNPVASAQSGTTKTVHYAIVARDNDDPTGGCNHSTLAPVDATWSFVVTNTGGGGLDACQACTSDAQCGGAGDHCITIGGMLRCGRACGPGGACPAASVCTASAVRSVDGVDARQCVPSSGACAAQVACTDDAFEENDALSAITSAAAQSLQPNTYSNLMACPRAGGVDLDEDWYGIAVTAESTVEVKLTSTAATDSDLALVDGNGANVDLAIGSTSNETVTACLPASTGKVYARVFSLSSAPAPAPYALAVTRVAASCACQPDAGEPDDTAAQAPVLGRPTSPASFTGRSLCPGNSDWYAVTVNAGDELVVDLVFNQANFGQDLDLHLYRPDGTTDLFPCSPTQSGCQLSNGQGVDSNEHMEWTAPAGQGGTYYVVVRGYDTQDTNTYGLAVKVQ